MALVMELGLNEGSGTTTADSSGNGFNCTVGSSGWAASGHAGSGYAPTSTQTVAWPVLGVGDSVFTIMAWVYRVGAPGSSTVVCDAGTSAATRWAIQSDGSITALSGRSTGVITASTWTHVAFVANGSTARTCYVNGVQVSQDTGSSSFLSASTAYNLLSNATAYLTWDDLRVFDHALTQTEVETWMNDTVGGGTTHAATGTIAVATAANGSPVARHVATAAAAILTTAAGAAIALHPATATTPVTTMAAGAPTARHPATGTIAVTTTTAGTADVLAGSGSYAATGTILVITTATGTANQCHAATGTVTATSSANGAPTARRVAAGACAAVTAAAGSAGVRYSANGTVLVVTTATGSAFVFDPTIPALPIDGVSLTVSAEHRGLTLTGEARNLEVDT